LGSARTGSNPVADGIFLHLDGKIWAPFGIRDSGSKAALVTKTRHYVYGISSHPQLKELWFGLIILHPLLNRFARHVKAEDILNTLNNAGED
jgi:hypothetical protein